MKNIKMREIEKVVKMFGKSCLSEERDKYLNHYLFYMCGSVLIINSIVSMDQKEIFEGARVSTILERKAGADGYREEAKEGE